MIPGLGHLPELLVVLFIGLLVFGPKRLMEMASSLGKALREMRDSLKDVTGGEGFSLRGLMNLDEPRQTPTARYNGLPNTVVPPTSHTAPAPSVPPQSAAINGTTVVEATVEHAEDAPED
jgi:sec-independent protein translocase protein TatA